MVIALGEHGWKANRKRVQRLMQQMGTQPSVETNLTVAEAVCIVPSRGVVGLNVKTQALVPPKEVTLER